jgi:hypothetical protein
MKSSIIPSQVTTIEDRISGSFSLTQIMLILSSVFVSVGIYAIVPEPNTIAGYKLALIVSVLTIAIILSIRISDKIILHHCVIILAFLLRKRTFVYNKNTLKYRSVPTPQPKHTPTPTLKRSPASEVSADSFSKNLSLQHNISIQYKFKKGGLHVQASQVRS